MSFLDLWLTFAEQVSKIPHYFKFKVVCSWCKPQRRISGWPYAKISTHSICYDCQRQVLSDFEQSQLKSNRILPSADFRNPQTKGK